MGENKQNLNTWSLLNKISTLVKSEVTTTAGKVNLISDLVLAAVVVTIFAANAFERIVISVVSIWNHEIMEYLSNADTLTAFIILVVFFIACLFFLYISERIARHDK